MFSSYKRLFPIHLRWYDLPLGTCRSGNLSVAPTRGEEHDACDTVRLYEETIREDALEHDNPSAAVRAPTRQELMVAKRVAAYEAGDMGKVARIDGRVEERCKWRKYHCCVRKYRSGVSKGAPSRVDKDGRLSQDSS